MMTLLPILVLEHRLPARAELRQRLAEAQITCEVHWADSVTSFSTALVEREWCLVITEFSVPGLALNDIVNMVIACSAPAPILLYTDQIPESQAVQHLEQGVTDYIMKDRPARLGAAIRRIWRRNAEHQQLLQVQHALQDEEERFRLAMQGSRDGVWDWALGTEQVYYSPSWKAMLGYHDQELPNTLNTLKHLCHPDDIDAMLARLHEHLHQGAEHFEIELRMRHREGRLHHILARAYIARDSHHTPTRLVGTFMDLTPLKQAEESLRQAGIVFNNTHDGVVITDKQGHILSLNPAFTQITGYSHQDAQGRNMHILQSGRQDRSFYQMMWASLKEQGFWQGAMWDRRKNGELYLQWTTISAVHNDHGDTSHYIAVFSDISQHADARKLDRFAHQDSLTGLPNHIQLQIQGDLALSRCQRLRRPLALLYFKLEHFERLERRLGTEQSHHLIKQLAHRLKSSTHDDDTLFRFGHDEFVLLLENLSDSIDAVSIADELLAQLEFPFQVPNGPEQLLSAGVSVALFPEHGHTIEDLLRQADSALRLEHHEH